MNFDDTARFFGPSNKLWLELFAPPSKRATRRCRECRKVEVAGIKRFCSKCAYKRKLNATNASRWASKCRKGRKTKKQKFAPSC